MTGIFPELNRQQDQTYQTVDHFGRNLMFVAICLICVVVIAMLYVNHEIDIKLDDAMKRWQVEHDKVELMTCNELKDAMLYNQIKASDNKQRATERFLGMECSP